MASTSWSKQSLELRVHGVELHIAALLAAGSEPVVFLHGFGSTKEEYADFAQFPGLAGRPFLAYDAPGFGESTATKLDAVSIPFLVDMALAVLDQLDVDWFHVVGHSMAASLPCCSPTGHPTACSPSPTSRAMSRPRTASSAGRSSPTAPTTRRPSSPPSRPAHFRPPSTPAPCTAPEC